MYIVFSLLCLPAVATLTNCLEFEISSQESSNNNGFNGSIIGKVFNQLKVNSLVKFKFLFAFFHKEVDNVHEKKNL